MLWNVLALIPVSMVISTVATWAVIRVAHRVGSFDTGPLGAQVKEAARRVPNVGGIGVFAAIAVPLLGALGAAWTVGPGVLPMDLVEGVRGQTPLAGLLLGGAAVLHVLGLVDDRRPLGPLVKLGVMTAVSAVVVVLGETRLLTMLDASVGGPWLSVALTVVWFLAVTNAMNFIDNMDGLSAGVAGVAGSCFLTAALLSEQWFVGAMLALLVGACAGFLVWNRPPARVFMGDGGSLVLGFMLAFLTTRTTYFGATPLGEPLAGGWYGVFMPLLVLAVPLYDMATVTALRLRQGRSPMVGDLQHLSHRLVKRGLGKPAAVGVIVALTAVTGMAGIVLGRLPAWGAAVMAGQTGLLLVVVACIEFATSPPGARRDSLEVDRRG